MAEKKLKILRTLDEIEGIREFWQTVVVHPNADLDLYKTIVQSRPEIKGPCVFLLCDGEIPKALLIGRIEGSSFEAKMGYLTVLRTPLVRLTFIHGGIGGEITGGDADLFAEGIRSLFGEKLFTAVFFNNVSFDSPVYKAVQNKIPFLLRDHVFVPNPHWSTAVQRNFDDFLKKIDRKHRSQMRRQAKILEEEYPGEVLVKTILQEDEVPALCRDAEIVAAKTYQRSIGVGFVDDNEMVQRLTLFARASCLRAYVLYIRKKPVAFWMGTLYKGTFYLDFTGYDAAFQAHQPGSYLFMKMLEDICGKTAANLVDFGLGDAAYKQRIGDKKWNEVSVMAFSPSIKGLRLNLIRQSSALLAVGISHVFSSHAIQFIKTKVRNYLRKKQIDKGNGAPPKLVQES